MSIRLTTCRHFHDLIFPIRIAKMLICNQLKTQPKYIFVLILSKLAEFIFLFWLSFARLSYIS